ncbi:hypothetical protein E2C01_053920 [Portunus trituberculatus]|uniref:Uncharacterized protein n=1 Tax=Portunus trituberculatus TaxID=210409 RepID=A0A5B7GIH5_PORTR|nr:hypothetical protein [Portunus trituberculatus]
MKADCLAQCALQDDTVDPGTEYTMAYVKSSIKDFVHSINDQLELIRPVGESRAAQRCPLRPDPPSPAQSSPVQPSPAQPRPAPLRSSPASPRPAPLTVLARVVCVNYGAYVNTTEKILKAT